METFGWLLTGGFAKGYRTQILGATGALTAVGAWAIGDLTLTQMIPLVFASLGVSTLGAKVDSKP